MGIKSVEELLSHDYDGYAYVDQDKVDILREEGQRISDSHILRAKLMAGEMNDEWQGIRDEAEHQRDLLKRDL
tara:strand:- start:440 stop:658 length:219 start_codon:yes stop_codon:yes gene_type:complete